MTVFDLLFLLAVPGALVTLIAAAIYALRGHGSRARRVLRRLGLCTIAYLATVAAVGWISPRRVLHVGDPWCFDDWCLSVEHVSRSPAPPQTAYTVTMQLSSRARRITQRAKGAWVCLVDGQGNRYAPEPDPAAIPLDVLLGPGESVTTLRTFRLPAGTGEIGLMTGHGGLYGFPSAIVIGDEASLFHKRTIVRLQ